MKKIIFVLVCLLTFTTVILCQSISLNNFTALTNALKVGQSVRVVIDYGKCKLIVNGKEEKAPEAIGGMDLKTFEYFARGSVNNEKSFITSSENVLISHPKHGYVYNYIKVRVYDDNTVEIIARYLDPKTFEVKMDETFYSSINAEKNNAAVFFYLN